MLTNPAETYRPFAPIALPDRTWSSQVITQPSIWLSTDLRDGNQALIEPMSGEQKLRMFELLIEIGFAHSPPPPLRGRPGVYRIFWFPPGCNSQGLCRSPPR